MAETLCAQALEVGTASEDDLPILTTFSRLLRLSRKAKRKEQGAESKDRDFFLHVFLFTPLTCHSTLAPFHLITLSARNSTD